MGGDVRPFAALNPLLNVCPECFEIPEESPAGVLKSAVVVWCEVNTGLVAAAGARQRQIREGTPLGATAAAMFPAKVGRRPPIAARGECPLRRPPPVGSTGGRRACSFGSGGDAAAEAARASTGPAEVARADD